MLVDIRIEDVSESAVSLIGQANRNLPLNSSGSQISSLDLSQHEQHGEVIHGRLTRIVTAE
jgi:hypothetical protein